MPRAQERIQLTDETLAVRDAPVALQHVFRGLRGRQRQLVHRVAVTQRVHHGRGEQARPRGGSHVLAFAAQMRGVVLVEPVPVLLLAGLAHVARRGNGALRACGRLLDVVIQQEHDDAPDGEPYGEGNLGQETRNHAPDSAR